MNVMCDDEGAFLALIDWGDAGWSDAAADFADIPLDALTTTVFAYEDAVPGLLRNPGIPRVIWYRVARSLGLLVTGRPNHGIAELVAYRDHSPLAWREFWG